MKSQDNAMKKNAEEYQTSIISGKHRLMIAMLFPALILFFLPSKAWGEEEEVYLYTSFHEPSTDGLRYLYSEDGLHWDSIPGIWLVPEQGKVLRDPSIIMDPDSTFHLVWTTQWKGNKSFGYAKSHDLIHWTDVKEIEIMSGKETDNVWAPELFYDEDNGKFLIIWASRIPEREYTAADTLGKNACHRLWYTTTKDFLSFSEPQRYYDPGFNSIDGYLIKRANANYVLILKDNRKPGYSHLFCAFSSSPYGPFHSPSTAFSPTSSEGPCAIPADDGWIIYYDHYGNHRFGAVFTTDFHSFSPIDEHISLPRNHKHGSIIKVKRKIIDEILSSASKHNA